MSAVGVVFPARARALGQLALVTKTLHRLDPEAMSW